MADAIRTAAQAIVNVVQAIVDRGQRPPSHAVQNGAAELIGRPGISYRPSITYEFYGECSHFVTLYLDEPSRYFTKFVVGTVKKAIVGARCDCDHHGVLPDTTEPEVEARVCKHITAALALSSLAGYYLETT